MFLLHCGTVNQTDRFRISCDTRFQLKTEPVDPRWAGPNPSGHDLEGRKRHLMEKEIYKRASEK
jgi:hypothetical protein